MKEKFTDAGKNYSHQWILQDAVQQIPVLVPFLNPLNLVPEKTKILGLLSGNIFQIFLSVSVFPLILQKRL